MAEKAASGENPKGFTCECGMEHEYSLYVFAHWYEALVHTCPNCNRKHEILCGVAALVKGTEPTESNHRSGGAVVEGAGL